MAKKISAITNDELVKTIQAEGLPFRFEDTEEVVRVPDVVGISQTKSGNYMVYCIDALGKMFNTSVHPEKEVANGYCLHQMRTLKAKRNEQDIQADQAEAVSAAEPAPMVEEAPMDITPAVESKVEEGFDLSCMSFDSLMETAVPCGAN